MKIRMGFVTNSSSSCFILGFESKETIAEELLDDSGAKGFVEEIYRCCKATKEQGKLKDILNGIEWEEENVLFGDLQDNYTYEEFEKFRRSKKYKQMLKERIDNFKKDAAGKNYFVSLECEGQMEYDAMPYLDCVIRRYSHH